MTSRCCSLTSRGAAALQPQWELPMALLGTPYILDAQQLQTFFESLLCSWHCSKCFQVLTLKSYEGTLLLAPWFQLWHCITSRLCNCFKSYFTDRYTTPMIIRSSGFFLLHSRNIAFFFSCLSHLYLYERQSYSIYLFLISPLKFILRLFLQVSYNVTVLCFWEDSIHWVLHSWLLCKWFFFKYTELQFFHL